MRLHRKFDSGSSTAAVSGKKKVNCKPGQEFVFRTPDGRQVGKAKNVDEFVKMVKSVPLESVLHHANGNDFASWLKLIVEKDVASKISKIRGNGEDVRLKIIDCF
ncbi:MAG: hypothetical protein ABIG39_01530 [Candidatus Micrarchaeota archaeon]